MKSLELVRIIERILNGEDVSQEDYTIGKSIVESILFNNNMKLLDSTEVFNQLLLKLFEKKDTYRFDISIYQRRNYIIKYLMKTTQETIQVSHNIIDIPLYVIEKGTDYIGDIYETYPERFFSEDFHEEVETSLLIKGLKGIVTPKEAYVLQRAYIDGVKKKDVAEELYVKPKKISSMLNKIKNKTKTVFGNEY